MYTHFFRLQKNARMNRDNQSSVRSSERLDEDSPLFEKFQKSRILFKCIHGGKSRDRPTTSTGIPRTDTHTKCMECPFQANLVLVIPNLKKKDSSPYFRFVVRSLKLEHNHPISQEHYMSYTRTNTGTVINNPDAVKLNSR